MFDPVYIYVPLKNQIIRIAEGAGDNLSDEDIDAGYVDYIYYDTHNVEVGMPEMDGGMIMLTELFQEKFTCTKDAIPSVLDMAYGVETLPYVVLERE
jgi:hypothetical protein